MQTCFDPAVILRIVRPVEVLTQGRKDLCSKVFFAPLFILLKDWNAQINDGLFKAATRKHIFQQGWF